MSLSDTDDGSLGDQLSDFANQQEHLGTFTSVMMESVLAWKSAHPHVILFVLLPPLLFEDAASMVRLCVALPAQAGLLIIRYERRKIEQPAGCVEQQRGLR